MRARAAHDFRCKEDEIEVENIAGGTYRAKGCGDAVVYNCLGSNSGPTPNPPFSNYTNTCQPEH